MLNVFEEVSEGHYNRTTVGHQQRSPDSLIEFKNGVPLAKGILNYENIYIKLIAYFVLFQIILVFFF